METYRAPRGDSLSCKGWPQEAALRMLLNNLDPEVAERPEDLVVYGGSGKAARNQEALARRSSPRSKTSRATRRSSCSPGKPVGVFRTHERAPRVLISNSMLVPAWANWDEFHRLEALGPHDVRPDDRRLVDLHRHAGDPAGHLRDAGRAGRASLRRLARRADRPHRRARGHGRSPAAGRHDERRRRAVRRGRPLSDRAPARDSATSTARRPTLDEAVAWARGGTGREACRVDRPAGERGRGPARATRARASSPTSSPTRPRLTTSSTDTSRPA